MEIGAKIKEARTRTGLTQEQAAEALGVSRKTISNWENEKTYPDIVSVVKMSDLYAVSLDRLLKDGEGGSEYLDYLGDSTDTVRSRRRLSILVLLTAYLCVWGLAVIVFWFFTTGSDAMGFSLIYLWLLLPAITVLVSLQLGRQGLDRFQTLSAVLGGGVMYMLAEYCTFKAANMAAFRGAAPARVGHAPGGSAALRAWVRDRRPAEPLAPDKGIEFTVCSERKPA